MSVAQNHRLPMETWQANEQENGFVLLSLCAAIKQPIGFDLHGHYAVAVESCEVPIFLFQAPTVTDTQLHLQALVHQSFWQNFSANLTPKNTHFFVTYQPAETSLPAFDQNQNQLFLSRENNYLPAGSLVFALAKLWQTTKHKNANLAGLALMHCKEGFAFRIKPARFMLPLNAQGAIGACPLLEDWKITNRLATDSGEVGTLDGSLADLIEAWLSIGFPNEHPWQVWLCQTNKKGQQELLTFANLQTVDDFTNTVLATSKQAMP